MAKRVRSSSLSGMSINELQAEIKRRARRLPAMLKKRAKLAAALAQIDGDIASVGGSAGRSGGGGKTGRRRPVNDSNLADALANLLKGKTMGVTEASIAVRKAGYNTNAANFRTIVNQCLIKHKKMFKKVARGQYTAA